MKLFLLDAYALIYRAYFSFANNHRYNSKKQNTSAQFGFTNTLLDVLQKEKPTHIAVVFDSPETGEREAIYEQYKANREQMPEDIQLAIPQIMEIIDAFNIPVIFKEGFEADDLIGALAKQAEKKGFTVYMMTPDKDYGQLVSENIFIYKPGRMGNPTEIMGITEVCKKFEISTPSQVIDLLSLWGDAVDNIPGIPGIGEKTGKKLLAEYGSLENILENVDKIGGKLGQKIAENKELAVISKKLATIMVDAPITLDQTSLELQEPDKEKIKKIFSELEFRSLLKKVLGEDLQVIHNGQTSLFSEETSNTITNEKYVDLKQIDDVPHEYKIILDENMLLELIKELDLSNEFCFDTETTSLNENEAEIIGLSFSTKPHTGYYIPLYPFSGECKNMLLTLKPYFKDSSKLKIAQNIKYDINILHKYGIEVHEPIFDTMIAHYLIMPDMRHNMDLLAETYLQYKPISITKLIGEKGKNQKNMKDVALPEIAEYATEDADITLQLKHVFSPELLQNNLEKLFFELEMPLTNILANMEREGVNIDVLALQEYSKKLESKLDTLTEKIYSVCNMQFNIDSPKQLGEVLYEKLNIIDKPKKTKTGQYATGEEVLVTLKNKHQIIDLILQYRMLRKLKNTYVDPLPLLVNSKTGRIHTSFMQTVAATGRLSSNNPNLQNIPIKTEEGREIRKAFVAKNSDYILVSADYSQIELRIIAALSNDENMKLAFKQKKDIHAATAAKVFGVKETEVTREMRIKAKAVNFGIIYGQGPFGLSQNLQISRTEAKEIIDNYFTQFPSIQEYMKKNIEFAKKNGYVETIMGRRRYLQDIHSNNAVVRGHAERNAVNAPIQGSAADIIKMAMIKIHKTFEQKNIQSKLILQVHDELVFDVLKSEQEEVVKIIQENMENAVKLSVPLDVEVGVGNNWLEAH